ncbi:uncharacterized protein [Diadema setosum]|uniref:uncharacterized protein n=1 Tax=Diadema setosum TaxID=31175 RepID=UPI003B3BCF76
MEKETFPARKRKGFLTKSYLTCCFTSGQTENDEKAVANSRPRLNTKNQKKFGKSTNFRRREFQTEDQNHDDGSCKPESESKLTAEIIKNFNQSYTFNNLSTREDDESSEDLTVVSDLSGGLNESDVDCDNETDGTLDELYLAIREAEDEIKDCMDVINSFAQKVRIHRDRAPRRGCENSGSVSGEYSSDQPRGAKVPNDNTNNRIEGKELHAESHRDIVILAAGDVKASMSGDYGDVEDGTLTSVSESFKPAPEETDTFSTKRDMKSSDADTDKLSKLISARKDRAENVRVGQEPGSTSFEAKNAPCTDVDEHEQQVGENFQETLEFTVECGRYSLVVEFTNPPGAEPMQVDGTWSAIKAASSLACRYLKARGKDFGKKLFSF